jgi:hypothetical protein
MSRAAGVLTLLVREVHTAVEEMDYVQGRIGHRALAPTFIHRMITRARDQRLAYLAVHNHFSDEEVGFSYIDLDSHELGYPALLQIAKGMPVGALVFGKRSVQADVWQSQGPRLSLESAVVVGKSIQVLTPSRRRTKTKIAAEHERQIRMFGVQGQAMLARCHVGIVGLGGIGSMVAEYLARLGVGRFTLVDPDRVESSNLSRIVGASPTDAARHTKKIRVAERVIRLANPSARMKLVFNDIAAASAAMSLLVCDYIFIAADSMRARLVCNAIVHQFLIPATQLGSKIRANGDGKLVDVMSANRPIRPGMGCLWCNQLIDPQLLAQEAKTDEERTAQAYGVREPNPSVVTLNAVSAAHATNDFLLDFLNLRPDSSEVAYEHFHFLSDKRSLVTPRSGFDCTECAPAGLRFARGAGIELPTSSS